MRRSLALALGLWCAAPAFAAPPVAPSAPAGSQFVTPNGATGSYGLTTLTGPTNFQVPRGHVGAWLPYSGPQSVDTGTIYYPSSTFRTAYFTFEAPRDATSIELILGNGGTSAVTLNNASAWGSSQWATPGFNSFYTVGVTPYNAVGSAVTAMPIFSFGNAGADSTPAIGAPLAVPAASASLTTNASSTGTTLNFGASISCPANGSTVSSIASTSTSNPLFYPNTTVTACTSSTNSTVTISGSVRNTVPAITTVYFLPPGATAPAATSAPFPSLVYSDWLPISTYTRIDGPIMSGMTVLNNGAALSGTVSATTPTSAAMSANLAADVPAGTSLLACTTATLSAQLTPVSTLQFAANANIQPGMTVWAGTSPVWDFSNTVASVSTSTNTTVTLTNPLDIPSGGTTAQWSNGATFAFVQQATTSAPTASGATLTLASVTNLSVGMSVYYGSVVGQQVIPGTISTIVGNVVTMSSNVTAAIPANQPLAFYFMAATNAAQTAAVQPSLSAIPANYVPGMLAVAAGLPANDWSFTNGTNLFLGKPPTSTLANGSTLYLCNPVTTSADSPAGQPNLNFSSTVWPNRLITVRLNYGSTGVNYWAPSVIGEQSFWAQAAGTPQRYTLGVCGAGTDGVLTTTNIGNTSGSCTSWGSSGIPLFGVKYYSPSLGVNIMVVGDSHPGGTTTMSQSMFARRAAWGLSSPTLPVDVLNLGWGGMPSSVYAAAAWPFVKSVQPEITLLQFTTPNDQTGIFAVANSSALTDGIAQYVKNTYGGLAVKFSDYQRQVYGCNVNSSANETIRLAGVTELTATALTGMPYFNPSTSMADPVNGANWFAAADSWDCIHANDIGHAAMAVGLGAFLKPYLRY